MRSKALEKDTANEYWYTLDHNISKQYQFGELNKGQLHVPAGVDRSHRTSMFECAAFTIEQGPSPARFHAQPKHL